MRDTERSPPPTVPPVASMQLLEQLTAHMVRHGVRRVAITGVIDVELDPAAQELARLSGAGSAEPETKREKPDGECVVPTCENKGGHLRTPYCREHFQSELRHPRRNR